MNDREQGEHTDAPSTDLVEYFVVVVPDLDSLAILVPALADLATTGLIRVLDMVAVARAADGTVDVVEVDADQSLAALARIPGRLGRLLSERDIAMAAVAVSPGTAGLILVTEDRWAEPLSSAAHRVGGKIVAGERLAPTRVQAALADATDDEADKGVDT